LIGGALFELLIKIGKLLRLLFQLVGSVTKLGQEAGIFDGNYR
jgi:hypothetical protein